MLVLELLINCWIVATYVPHHRCDRDVLLTTAAKKQSVSRHKTSNKALLSAQVVCSHFCITYLFDSTISGPGLSKTFTFSEVDGLAINALKP